LRFAITSPHLDVKRTCTSKLSIMHGVHKQGRARVWRGLDCLLL
jgi:hypothetical protein